MSLLELEKTVSSFVFLLGFWRHVFLKKIVKASESMLEDVNVG